MIEYLLNIDKKLFLFINGNNNSIWDTIFVFASGKKEWIPVYLLLLALLIYKYRQKSYIPIFTIILAVILADQISVHLFKDIFQRLRPCHQPELNGLIHLVNNKCGGLFGFVSSHAANSFAVAILLAFYLRKNWISILLIVWAAFVSYSRIYLGVHYPADVFCGALLGSLLAWRLYVIQQRFIHIN